MSKRAKNWLIAAAALVAVGVILFVTVMTVYHWDFSLLSTDRLETNTYEIGEDFDDIKLDTETADILFAASNDGVCRVVCCEEENMKHSVGVQDGTLTVTVADDRAWYEHIGFSFRSPKITVYLPKAEYGSIVIKESTGDITVNAISAGTLDLSVSTGEIALSDVTCKGDIKATVSTGDIRAVNTACQNLISTGSTGDISLKNTTASGEISLERSTGDIVFDGADAAEVVVKTSTGNVTGFFLSPKVFIAHSDTGNVHVPETTSGGKCKITTSTGDIKIKIHG